jgi:TPR repeat protein
MSEALPHKTANHWRGNKTVAVVVGSLAIVIAMVGFWLWWQRAPDADTAMARGQYERAFDLYLKDARQGDPRAQTSVGNLYYLGLGTRRDYAAALRWYYEAARQSHAPALLNIGHLYKQGLGVKQDVMRAFAWYNMANNKGNPQAEKYLGLVASEWALSPLMMSTAKARWPTLEALLQEAL